MWTDQTVTSDSRVDAAMSTPSLNERTRLLSLSRPSLDPPNNDSPVSPLHALRPEVVCILVLQFITNFAFYHLLAPKLWILELTICRKYYAFHDPSVIVDRQSWPGYNIDESKCKHGSIQREVSALRAWGVFLDGLCGRAPHAFP
jgi:hypothetical protein